MTKEINVSSSIDDSVKLQKIIDTCGNTPAKFIFPDNHHLSIKSLIRFYNYAEISGAGSTWELKENAPVNPFGVQIPLIAPKYPSAAKGLRFHDIIFEGNRDTQNNVPLIKNKKWGNGYHNYFLGGVLNNVKYSNTSDCEFYNLQFNNSLGDGIRIEGGTNISIHDIKGHDGGHDIICCAAAKDVEVSNVEADTAVNAGVRFRSVTNGKIHGCKLNGTKINTGPLIQVQNTAVNWNCTNIEVYDNYLNSSLGPAMWVFGNTGANDIHIHNNLFYNCGIEPASVKTDDVGGICTDGFDAEIEYNTFDKCSGFGVVFSGWQATGSMTGVKSTVKRNIITGTKKSLYTGTSNGTGIANLTGSRNVVTCLENCQYGNIAGNYYGVTVKSKYDFDPLFIGPGDYHLKANSPCRFSDYQLGCYSDTTETDDPVTVMVSCPSDTVDTMIKSLSSKYTVYKED